MAKCYMIVTSRSLLWFILSLVASMLLAYSLMTPKWLIGPERIKIEANNFTIYRNPSVGIYTRCKLMSRGTYHCGAFDLNGLLTDGQIYPAEWKATMVFISLGLGIMSLTVIFSMASCCRQSLFQKSIHNIAGSGQVVAGISIMVALFLHPLGWGAQRVISLCGLDAEAFYPADCVIGSSMYCAIAGKCLCFLSAILSLKAESANLRQNRIEEGEVMICVP